MRDQTASFLLRRIAGPDADGDLVERLAATRGSLGDADEWRAQVALDVDGKSLQRRDVEHASADGIRPGSCSNRSMLDRNAASVLPDPVGATTKT